MVVSINYSSPENEIPSCEPARFLKYGCQWFLCNCIFIIFACHDVLVEVVMVTLTMRVRRYAFFLYVLENSHLELVSTLQFVDDCSQLSLHGGSQVIIQFPSEVFFVIDPFLCKQSWLPPNRCFLCVASCVRNTDQSSFKCSAVQVLHQDIESFNTNKPVLFHA